jgi:hypothetical protein
MNCFSGKKLNWVNEIDVYNFSNSLQAVVYAFGLFDKEPNNNLWPFFTKEVYYIGMSGGLKESFYVDKKSENHHRLETVVHKRMKDHKCKNDGKIKNKWVQEQISSGKQLYISFILPPPNLESNMLREGNFDFCLLFLNYRLEFQRQNVQ